MSERATIATRCLVLGAAALGFAIDVMIERRPFPYLSITFEGAPLMGAFAGFVGFETALAALVASLVELITIEHRRTTPRTAGWIVVATTFAFFFGWAGYLQLVYTATLAAGDQNAKALENLNYTLKFMISTDGKQPAALVFSAIFFALAALPAGALAGARLARRSVFGQTTLVATLWALGALLGANGVLSVLYARLREWATIRALPDLHAASTQTLEHFMERWFFLPVVAAFLPLSVAGIDAAVSAARRRLRGSDAATAAEPARDDSSPEARS